MSCCILTLICFWFFPPQKMQLLKLNVPSLFMLVALDEGPGPPIKYQYAELNRLYSVVSVLVRCCDVSSRCLSSNVSLFAVVLFSFCDTWKYAISLNHQLIILKGRLYSLEVNISVTHNKHKSFSLVCSKGTLPNLTLMVIPPSVSPWCPSKHRWETCCMARQGTSRNW